MPFQMKQYIILSLKLDKNYKKHVINTSKKKNKIDGNDTSNNINNKRSLEYPFFLFPPISRKNCSSEKVSLCTLTNHHSKPGNSFIKQASMAVETALALPIFFLCLVTIISFMNIYQVQTEHLSKLCQKAKVTAMYAYHPGGGGADHIVMPDVYSYQPLRAILPLPALWFQNNVKVRNWTGVVNTYFKQTDQGIKMVFMTPNGSVYHKKANCSYLNVSVKQMNGRQAENAKNIYGERYYACEMCSKRQSPSGVVYVTDQGNRYHNQQSCSGLKRTILLVKETDASARACSRCGGG